MRQTSSPTQDAQIRFKIKYRKQRLRAFLHVASDVDAPKGSKNKRVLSQSIALPRAQSGKLIRQR